MPAAPPNPTRARPVSQRFVAGFALLVAGVFLAVWLWSEGCQFCGAVWNDMRLAPTIALAQGWSVYPTGEQGVINTWTYGPLPLLFFWPASWAPTAAGAMMVAAGLNLALALVPIALVCFTWPSTDRAFAALPGRMTAFLLCVALWPEANFATYYPDNLALACGLAANLLLVRARGPRELWLAALAATAAIACKQTALGIPLAQVLWLGFTTGWIIAGRHALRCVIAGAAIGALSIAAFGWDGLWFVLVELPAHFRWIYDPMERLHSVAPDLALHVGLPVVVMMLFRRVFARPAWLLPALAWGCALPFGVAALSKIGGRMNSMHGFLLWLPPVLTMLFTARMAEPRHRTVHLAAALVAAALACGRVLDTPRLSLRPDVACYRQAEQLAAQFRGRIWFPLNPLVTLYSEHRYYHDEDGLYVRKMTHKSVSLAQATAHLPPAMHVMAFPDRWGDWNIARSMLPPNARHVTVGEWTVWSMTTNDRPR